LSADIKIRIPDAIRPGESFVVKTLALAPPLDDPAAGFDAAGLPVPHFVAFDARLDGRLAWHADLGPGVSRDVALSFSLVADQRATVTLRWTLRDGGTEERSLTIRPDA
jgi:hypothetical protein